MGDAGVYRTLIDADALAILVERGQVALFDCRFDLADTEAGRAAYLAGHIPGAFYLHLDDDLSAPAGPRGRHPLPDRAAFAARLAAYGLNAGQQVVAYDAAGGAYAARLWWMLRWVGHEAVAVLDGGLPAWAASGRRLVHDVPAPAAGSFRAAPPLASAADVDEVLNGIGGDMAVVDARAPHRFRGESDPLDPVSGRIPGARNRFFRDNLDAAGRFKPGDVLAAEWRAVLAGTPAGQVVHQCGSGVTATHNVLAMEVAGLSGSRLYPGSWSEWIADPARPIERG
jgi:thiosulfate/3-mercaptopyruvate sulfurtransferase